MTLRRRPPPTPMNGDRPTVDPLESFRRGDYRMPPEVVEHVRRQLRALNEGEALELAEAEKAEATGPTYGCVEATRALIAQRRAWLEESIAEYEAGEEESNR